MRKELILYEYNEFDQHMEVVDIIVTGEELT
jgi:hypothetical protein